MAIQTPITIAKAIEAIQSTEYVLPAIQREFVWNAEQIQRLFDSLMRGYPIGSFLFWRIEPKNLGDYQFYRFIDRYHKRDKRHNEPVALVGERPAVAILDGQQRLTALNIGLKGSYADKLPYYRYTSDYAYPKRRLYLNIMAEPEDDGEYAYQFRLLKDGDAKKRDDEQFWFPVGDILQFKEIDEVYEFATDNELIGKELKHPSKSLVRLWNVITQKPLVSYFQEEDQDLNKVLNIFIRVNSGGTELSYSDMLLSIATAQWQNHNAREAIYELVDGLNRVGGSFNLTKDFVLKSCLVLSDISNVAFKVNNFNRENMLLIEQKWPHIVRTLNTTMRLLASWGYNRDTLAANNAIIPLAYYLMKREQPSEFVMSPGFNEDRELMWHWLRAALLKRTFSGQPDSVLRKIRGLITAEHARFPSREIFAAFSGTAKSMAFDEDQIDALLDYQYGDGYTFSVLASLYPWLDFENHFHMDHIFPRAMFTPQNLKKSGIPEGDWYKWLDHKDDLANLQLLQGLVNQNKSDKEFEAWLMHSHPTDMDLQAYMKENMIPDVPLTFENFPEFLEARGGLIKKKLAEDLRMPGETEGV